MSFDTPHGTRGARQPGGKLMAWMNRWNMNRIRGNAQKVMGMQALVLSTVGAKSGTPRHTPVAYFPDGANSWLIVASANGAAKNPAWYYNLAAPPTPSRSRSPAAPSRSAPSSCTAPPASTPGATSPARQTVSRNMSRKPTAYSPSSGCAPDPSQRSRPHAPTLPARSPVDSQPLTPTETHHHVHCHHRSHRSARPPRRRTADGRRHTTGCAKAVGGHAYSVTCSLRRRDGPGGIAV